jgi:hypothetical protein
MEPEPVVPLFGGGAVLAPSAVYDVLAALDAAQAVTQRRDGYGPHRRWLRLRALLEDATALASSRSSSGTRNVPRLELGPPPPDDALDSKIGSEEAAVMLGVTARNVRALAGRGTLRSGRKVAGRLLLSRSEVEAEVHRRAEAHTPEEIP